MSVDEGARTLNRTIADHVLVSAQAQGSVAVNVEVDGGRRKGDTRFRFEIDGEQGTLALDGGAAVGCQAGRLKLTLDGLTETVNEGELASLPEAAANVAAVYASLRDDIANGTWNSPDFSHAVRLAKLLADTYKASNRSRCSLNSWCLQGAVSSDPPIYRTYPIWMCYLVERFWIPLIRCISRNTLPCEGRLCGEIGSSTPLTLPGQNA